MAGSQLIFQLNAPVERPFRFSVLCPAIKAGFPTLCHNKVRDLTASLLMEVCSNMEVEPVLQQLSGEELSEASANRDDGAQMDVAADGF